MNELKIFENPEFGKIRTVVINGEPWFVGKYIAQVLGYANPSKAIIDHVDDEDKRFEMLPVPDSQNGNLVKTALINESGVYSLIFSSKLPKAKEFKRWVTSEVLPSIRKQGAYLTPAAAEQLEKVATGMEALADRVTALERERSNPFQLAAPPENEKQTPQIPGKAALKRWMRTASEKLDLLSNKVNLSHNAILHKLYGFLEKDFGVVLEEERLLIMEELGLEECSTLKAVFYDDDFREDFQKIVDYNLAPENRGW